MGRLAGFSYRDVTRRLRKHGFEFDREGAGSHEIWAERPDWSFALIPNHRGDIAEGTLRSILRQAGVSVDDFLAD